MELISVVVFGNVPLGTWVLETVRQVSGVRIAGVVCDPVSRSFAHHKLSYECVFDYAVRNGIPILSLQQLPEVFSGDRDLLGISCRFPHIIRPAIIRLFDRGIVNLHGGELPRFRGVNIANHVILERCSQGAGTLHFIDEGVDTGPIIARAYFAIGESDTAYDVFLNTQSALMTLFEQNLEGLLQGRVKAVSQQVFIDSGETAKTYRAADLDQYRWMPLDVAPEDLLLRVRAFHFPGHEQAYWIIGNRKVYATLEARLTQG